MQQAGSVGTLMMLLNVDSDPCHHAVAACPRVVNASIRQTSKMLTSRSLSRVGIVESPYDFFGMDWVGLGKKEARTMPSLYNIYIYQYNQ